MTRQQMKLEKQTTKPSANTRKNHIPYSTQDTTTPRAKEQIQRTRIRDTEAKKKKKITKEREDETKRDNQDIGETQHEWKVSHCRGYKQKFTNKTKVNQIRRPIII